MKLVLVSFWEFSQILKWFGSYNYKQYELELAILTIPKGLVKNIKFFYLLSTVSY